MITIRHKENILRNADNVVYGIMVDIECYKEPIAMKDRLVRENFDDAEPTINVQEYDWDNSTKLGSESHQFLIPENKQTDTFPTANRETNTEYDTLIWEWRTLYQQDSDIQRIELELMDANREHDGIQE